MEGWDAGRDGAPSEHTLRRWRNFGRSGAKLIWGGEAAAVRPDGRANPNQTLATGSNRAGLAALLAELTNAHAKPSAHSTTLVGLQLTTPAPAARRSSQNVAVDRLPPPAARCQVQDRSERPVHRLDQSH